MKREDSSIYSACLDETIKVLRTIEFMKTAIVYKMNNQKDNFDEVFGTRDANHTVSDIPDLIRSMKYDSTPGTVTPDASMEGDELIMNSHWRAQHAPNSKYTRLEFFVTPHFIFNSMTLTNGQLSFGNQTFGVYTLDGNYSINGITEMGHNVYYYYYPQEDNLEIEYIHGNGFEVVKPVTSNQTVTLDGLFRGFRARLAAASDSTFSSPGCFIKTLTVPVNVKELGSYFCYNAYRLTTVNIKASITTLPSYAFAYCPALTTLNVPESVITIKNDCFSHDASLFRNATLNLNTPSLTTIEARAFEYCSGLQSITFGPHLSSIGESAFAMCSSLNTLTFTGTTPPTIVPDRTGNGTSFYRVGAQGTVNIPNDASVGEWAQWMSNEVGPYSHLQDYAWSIYQNNTKVWPQ